MSTKQQQVAFFKRYFADAFPLLGEHHIVETFGRVKPLPLVSVKCDPHAFGERILLMGDAAHAMVPFYGQGMNCVGFFLAWTVQGRFTDIVVHGRLNCLIQGFEDCLVLSDILKECGDDIRACPVGFHLFIQLV